MIPTLPDFTTEKQYRKSLLFESVCMHSLRLVSYRSTIYHPLSLCPPRTFCNRVFAKISKADDDTCAAEDVDRFQAEGHMNFGFAWVPPSGSPSQNDQQSLRPSPQESTTPKMTPTPPSTTTTTSNGQFSPDGQYRVVRKRNRVPLSCAPCRNRK